MSMTLFYGPGAISQAVHIVLREAGLPFTLDRVDFEAQRTAAGRDYRAINPGGFVPALMLDDGTVMTETAALLQYIADRAPEKRLAPPLGSMERYRLMELLSFIATEIYKQYFGFMDAKDVAAVAAKLARRYAQIEQRLAGREWLMGGDFGIADAYLFVTLSWAPMVQFDLAPFPGLRAHQARVAARQSVQEALAAEGPMQH